MRNPSKIAANKKNENSYLSPATKRSQEEVQLAEAIDIAAADGLSYIVNLKEEVN